MEDSNTKESGPGHREDNASFKPPPQSERAAAGSQRYVMVPMLKVERQHRAVEELVKTIGLAAAVRVVYLMEHGPTPYADLLSSGFPPEDADAFLTRHGYWPAGRLVDAEQAEALDDADPGLQACCEGCMLRIVRRYDVCMLDDTGGRLTFWHLRCRDEREAKRGNPES